MSRSVDLMLLGLVGGLAWWLFGRDERPLDPEPAAPGIQGVAELAAPRAPSLGSGEAPPAAPPVASLAVIWAVDDAAFLAHPSFQFVVAEASTGRLLPLAWERSADGRVAAEFGPGQRALGLALVHPTLEVLAWLPLDATTRLPEELPVRLGERFARIAFDVRDSAGEVVHDARLSLRSAEPARTIDGERASLPVDTDGKVLLPRRRGLCIDVQSARGTATVDEPVDGRVVQLTAR